ncbi:MAG: glycosyltransferase family 4 protein [Bacteroides sp.]|nr:glycosyltransferase family 4 protein [Bacteroides sp.]
MMNIVVLCGSYDPKPSAVAICAKNVVKALEDMGNEVTVMIPYDGFESPDKHVIRFSGKDNQKYHSGSRVWKFIIRAKRYASALIHKHSINKQLIQGYLKQLTKKNEESKIDLIIPFSFPFESIVAAVAFKRQSYGNVKITPVIFDNYVDNPSLHRLRINMRLKRRGNIRLVDSLLSQCNKCFIIHSQRDFFEKNIPGLLPQIDFIEHPLLIPPIKEIKSDGNLLYSGSFLKGYVKSTELIKLLKIILPEITAKIIFCVMGNDVKNVEQFASENPSNVENRGQVPFQDAQEYIHRAGILFSVSEIAGIQISSKVFNYMTTGKPIIQFYYDDNDVNIELLKKYPLKYCFKLRMDGKYSREELNELVEFINAHRYTSIDFAKVIEMYPEASPLILAKQLSKFSNGN